MVQENDKNITPNLFYSAEVLAKGIFFRIYLISLICYSTGRIRSKTKIVQWVENETSNNLQFPILNAQKPILKQPQKLIIKWASCN